MVIDFSFQTKYGTYSDAISYSDDQPLTDEEIETIKQQRLNNWLSLIENPPGAE